MKKLYAYCIMLLSIMSCSDDKYSTELDFRAKREESFESVLNNYALLDTAKVVTISKILKKSDTYDPVFRFDPIEKIGDFYHPLHETYRITGCELKHQFLVQQSSDVIWPGNLIQGESVKSGVLAPIPIAEQRAPIGIYLNVVSGQDMRYGRTDLKASGSSVTQAMNDILYDYKYDFPANIEYSSDVVFSKDHLCYLLDMDNVNSGEILGNVFDGIDWNDSSKSRMLVKLSQIYFEMVYDFNDISTVFKEDINPHDLKNYVSDKNPMCYISSVSYGRYYVLLYETNNSVEELSEVIDRTFNANSEEALNENNKEILKKSTVKLVQIGGNADAGLNTISGDAEKIRNFIIEGAQVSKTSPGAPLFIKLRYLNNSWNVPIYKNINSEYKVVRYEKEIKKNHVKIEIRDITSEALTITGGNYSHIRNGSNFSMGEILVEVVKDNKVILNKTFDPKIHQQPASNRRYHNNYNHVLDLGELGENTDKRVRISFLCTYYARRYSQGLVKRNNSKGETRTFRFFAEYKFDKHTEKWCLDSNSMPNMEVGMDYFSLKGRNLVDLCGIDFKLNFKFSANRISYLQNNTKQ